MAGIAAAIVMLMNNNHVQRFTPAMIGILDVAIRMKIFATCF
jgi:hypothetical protein